MTPGYSRDGDTVTLTMTVDDYQNLLICLSVATGSDPRNLALFYSRIAMVNRLNAGNPDFTPYGLPEAYR